MGSREGVARWCPIMLAECSGKLTEDGAAQETRHFVYSCRLGRNDTYTRLCRQVFDLLFIESEFYWKLRRRDCECAPGVIRKVVRASHASSSATCSSHSTRPRATMPLARGLPW